VHSAWSSAPSVVVTYRRRFSKFPLGKMGEQIAPGEEAQGFYGV